MLDLFQMLKSYKAVNHRIEPMPKSRRLVAGIAEAGRNKNIIQALIEADITEFMAWRARAAERGGQKYSTTAYVSSCLAKLVGEQPELQAYKSTFGSHLIIFEDVDIVFTVERMIEGKLMPMTYTVRNCNNKSVGELDEALKGKKTEQIEGTKRWAIATWMMNKPWLIRRFFWFLLLHNPYLMRSYTGTVAVTSITPMVHKGFFGGGFPLSPMTLTLTVGGISQKAVRVKNEWVQRDVIVLTLGVDHDVVDGAPLARLSKKLSRAIANPKAIIGYE